MYRCDFGRISEPQLQTRTVSTENQEKNVQNLFLFNNIKDGTLLPQVIPGGAGTRPKAGGAHEFNSFFFFKKMFVAVVFAYSWWRSAVTDGGCKQYTSYVTFSHAVNTHSLLHITLHGSRMCWCASSHLHGHPCHAPECWPFFDSLFLTFFHSVCFSCPFFFYLNLELNLFLHEDVIGAISHCRNRPSHR